MGAHQSRAQPDLLGLYPGHTRELIATQGRTWLGPPPPSPPKIPNPHPRWPPRTRTLDLKSFIRRKMLFLRVWGIREGKEGMQGAGELSDRRSPAGPVPEPAVSENRRPPPELRRHALPAVPWEHVLGSQLRASSRFPHDTTPGQSRDTQSRIAGQRRPVGAGARPAAGRQAVAGPTQSTSPRR